MTKTTKEIIIESLGYDEKEFDKDYNPYDLNFKTNWFSQSEVDKIKRDLADIYDKGLVACEKDYNNKLEQLRQELNRNSYYDNSMKQQVISLYKIKEVLDKYGVDDSNESHLNEGRSEGVNPSNPNNIHCNICHSYGRDCSTPDDECCRLLEKHHIHE